MCSGSARCHVARDGSVSAGPGCPWGHALTSGPTGGDGQRLALVDPGVRKLALRTKGESRSGSPGRSAPATPLRPAPMAQPQPGSD